jgi:hypothetical protein
VSFSEALTVFANPLARIFVDEDHSIDEQREIIIGNSPRQRLLVICFSAREDTVRIFSARRASRGERWDYEENVRS